MDEEKKYKSKFSVGDILKINFPITTLGGNRYESGTEVKLIEIVRMGLIQLLKMVRKFFGQKIPNSIMLENNLQKNDNIMSLKSPSKIIEENPGLKKYWLANDIGYLLRLGLVAGEKNKSGRGGCLVEEKDVLKIFRLIRVE